MENCIVNYWAGGWACRDFSSPGCCRKSTRRYGTCPYVLVKTPPMRLALMIYWNVITIFRVFYGGKLNIIFSWWRRWLCKYPKILVHNIGIPQTSTYTMRYFKYRRLKSVQIFRHQRAAQTWKQTSNLDNTSWHCEQILSARYPKSNFYSPKPRSYCEGKFVPVLN